MELGSGFGEIILVALLEVAVHLAPDTTETSLNDRYRMKRDLQEGGRRGKGKAQKNGKNKSKWYNCRMTQHRVAIGSLRVHVTKDQTSDGKGGKFDFAHILCIGRP